MCCDFIMIVRSETYRSTPVLIEITFDIPWWYCMCCLFDPSTMRDLFIIFKPIKSSCKCLDIGSHKNIHKITKASDTYLFHAKYPQCHVLKLSCCTFK